MVMVGHAAARALTRRCQIAARMTPGPASADPAGPLRMLSSHLSPAPQKPRVIQAARLAGGDAPRMRGLRFGRFVWEALVSTGPRGHRAVAIRAHSHLRASDADRDQVLEFLKIAFVQGRLTIDELDARAGQALASRTYGELAVLTADIPSGAGRMLPDLPVAPEGVLADDPAPAPARTPASAKAAVWAACVIAGLPAVWAIFLTFYGGFVILFLLSFTGLVLTTGPRSRDKGTIAS